MESGGTLTVGGVAAAPRLAHGYSLSAFQAVIRPCRNTANVFKNAMESRTIGQPGLAQFPRFCAVFRAPLPKEDLPGTRKRYSHGQASSSDLARACLIASMMARRRLYDPRGYLAIAIEYAVTRLSPPTDTATMAMSTSVDS